MANKTKAHMQNSKFRSDKLVEFFKKHPAVSFHKVEKKLLLPQSTLSKAIKGKRNIPSEHLDKLEEELRTYGFNECGE